MRIRLSDEGGRLVLLVEGEEMSAFRRSALWKLRMPSVRRNVECFDGQSILLKATMTGQERARVVETLERLAPHAFELVRDATVGERGESLQSHVVQKSHVGLAIRAHSPELLAQFDEFSQVVDGAMVRPLRQQQLWDAFHMCSMGSAANFSVPGSGKTATTLATFAFLRERGLATRVVVVCPLSAFEAWKEEWAACFGDSLPLRCLDFHEEPYLRAGIVTKRKELRYNAGRYNLILLNYEALGGYVKEVRELVAERTLLVYDEVHKVKRIGGQWATAALEAARRAPRVIALTGTPIPNSYCDLYNLLHILYPNDYDSFFGYKPRTLACPSEEDVQEINKTLQPFFCRTDKKSLGVPDAADDRLCRVAASPYEQELFWQLTRTYGHEHLSLIVRMLQLESDPTMLGMALTPDELEGLFDEEESCERAMAAELRQGQLQTTAPTAKMAACVRLVRELVGEGKSVVLWCFFRQSMRNLSVRLNDAGCPTSVVNGATGQAERVAALDDFHAGRSKVLVTNPHTLGESVSLHDVCHDAVYFEYGYNLVHLLQSKDRIHRLGLPLGQYTQYHFLQTVFEAGGGSWSLDANIYERLREKELVMLEAIDQGVLEVGDTDERDLELVFRDLFCGSTEGMMGHAAAHV